MNQRERPSASEGSVAAPRSSSDLAVPLTPPLSTPLIPPLSPMMLTAAGNGSSWEQWYESASALQRQRALGLASERGMLFAHELPAPEGAPHASRRPLMTALLHGPAPELEPVRPTPIQPIDTDLDEVQRDAVSRALSTPDLCLIQGYAGTGKSRVIAEVLRQSVRAGLRVLFLAPGAAAIDRVLERLAGDSHLGILRCPSQGEDLSYLPKCVVPLTLRHRLRTFEEQTLPAARQALETARSTLEVCRQEEAAWDRLERAVEHQGRLQAHNVELRDRRAALPATIEAELERAVEGSTFSESWQSSRRASQHAGAELRARLAVVQQETERLAAEQRQRDLDEQSLAPIATAKLSGKWWTPAWWSARLHSEKVQRFEQLRSQSSQTKQRLQELRASEKELTLAVEKHEASFIQTGRDLIEGELARRDAELASEQLELAKRCMQANEAVQAALKQLSAGTGSCLELTPENLRSAEVVRTARAEWSAVLDQAKKQADLREQWVHALQSSLTSLPAQLAAGARIVAGVSSSLPSDPLFGDHATSDPFDLLVIEEAQRIGDSELLSLARRARRWLLVGDVATDLPVPPPPPRRNGPARPRPVQARPAFQRLWSQLHCDPRRLPARWRVLGGRLIACLHAITADQEPWVQTEPVFDRPEIELRIVSPPRKEPIVAEVLFPAAMPIEQAKEFICHELQELSVQAGGPGIRWSEPENGVILELGHGSDCSASTITLETGVCELISPCARPADDSEIPWRTCSLVFDRTAGWDRARAERWVAERLSLRDSGRTAVLYRPYRAREPLARFLSEVLYSGLWNVPCTAQSAHSLAGADHLPAVEFVPVPPTRPDRPDRSDRPDGRRAIDDGRRAIDADNPARAAPISARPSSHGGIATVAMPSRVAKGGAGVEIDLSDPRRRDDLPGEARAILPGHGIVNLLEARAIVEAVEVIANELTGDANFKAAGDGPAAAPSVAVMSVFPTQVSLLKLLLDRSPVLAGSSLNVEVGLPGAFHQREAQIVLVSLTRSHATRAVPFSDTPHSLLLALTRPAGRLILFGDPGTMARRSQWHGGLDHLDEVVGPIEQALLGQLLGQMNKIVNRFRESTGV